MEKINIFWFRRDLRLHDNCGLSHALKEGLPVLAIFIFDKNILEDLDDKSDARIGFIHQELSEINLQLEEKGSLLKTVYSSPEKAFEDLIQQFDIKTVYSNKDYEPYAISRDKSIGELLNKKDIAFHSYKDQVIFEEKEIVKADGTPYLVYTPFSKKWLATVSKENLKSYKSGLDFGNWYKESFKSITPLEEMGFTKSKIKFPKKTVSNSTLETYEEERNIPGKDSTSKMGVHLRFGTVSVRELCRQTEEVSLTYYKELIWREFFMMILFHFPHVVDQNYNSKYDGVKWRNNQEDFEKWCKGETGFPLVDAGMRELNETGFMHNRVRMLVASFLTKHLLIDWKWGEAYFAKKLLDYDLSSNNGNWQWCAGTGVDASPYFRVFNPTTQIEKFDKNHIYIRRWVKDFNSKSYPEPMVEHKFARERAISTYKEAISGTLAN